MDANFEKYLMSLGQISGMSQRSVTELIDAFGDSETAWRSVRDWDEILSLPKDKLEALFRAKKEVDPDVVAAYREKLGVKIVSVLDDDYPDPLRNVEDPPFYLYYFGTLPDPDKLTIAVVGARKATDYGKAATEKLVTDLAEKAHVQIANGMAEGIDGEALRAVLKAGGHGTAFLGCGIDVVYPAFHRKLYEELKVKGCVISEYPFGYPSLRQNFPRRNRLMSGIAQGVLVIEGNRSSGTLHTVNHGLEQGKNIYALPGSIFSKKSELPHYLIEAGQAKFTACAEDILEDFIDVDLVERLSRSERVDAFRLAENDAQRGVVLELQRGRRTFDELAEASGLSASQLTSFLTLLEIEGAIKETPGNTYMLIQS